MHFCTFVIIPPDGDVESLVARALAPFDESLEVEPYQHYLKPYEIERMAQHYGLELTDLASLAAKMMDWTNHPGGVDEKGLYWVTSINPDGQWDWYEIGGRWHGHIPGSQRNVIHVETLLKSPHLKDRLPACLVSAAGTWSAKERYVEDETGHGHIEAKSDEHWLEEVETLLRESRKFRVVCVDMHC
jgi:hypothetical protein